MNKHYSDGNRGEAREELVGLKWKVNHPLDFLHGGFLADSRLGNLFAVGTDHFLSSKEEGGMRGGKRKIKHGILPELQRCTPYKVLTQV